MNAFHRDCKDDEKAFREGRTKRAIRKIYDAMADVVRTGTVYPANLNLRPVDPRVAHPRGSRRAWVLSDGIRGNHPARGL